MSNAYVTAVLKTALPRPEKLVCVAIASHVDKFGEGCYASYRTLADETSYDERQVIRIVAKLEAAGIVVFQQTHPEYGTNIWNIDKKMLAPRPKAKRLQHAESEPVFEAVANDGGKDDEPAGVSHDPSPYPLTAALTDADEALLDGPIEADDDLPDQENVTLASDKPPQPGVTKWGFEARKMSPNLSSGNGSLEREKKSPAAYAAPPGRKRLPPALDATFVPPGRGRARADDEPAREPIDGPEDPHARFRPETDLQRKIAQLCGSNHLSLHMKGRLQRTLTLARGKQLPQTYPSPEDEWRAHPHWFNEYVELCAKRIREHTGRRPGRDMLISWILQYNLPKYGWLDFKERKEIGEAPIRQTQGRHYSKPGTPAWRA